MHLLHVSIVESEYDIIYIIIQFINIRNIYALCTKYLLYVKLLLLLLLLPIVSKCPDGSGFNCYNFW